MRFTLATHSASKRVELAILLREVGIEADLPDELPDPAQTATTFLGNAAIKAAASAKATGQTCIADDTGLVIADIPSGGPGIRARPLAEKHGGWEPAMRAICEEHGLLSDTRPLVKAHFVCAMAVSSPDGATTSRQATIDGRLRWPPRGEPEGFIPIFASYDPMRKDGVLAHRRAAFDELWRVIKNNFQA